MSATDLERLEAKLAEADASYHTLREVADRLYAQGFEMAVRYKTILTDMNNLREEHHRFSKDLAAIKLSHHAEVIVDRDQQIDNLIAENQLLGGMKQSRESVPPLDAFTTEHSTPKPVVTNTIKKRPQEFDNEEIPIKSISKVARIESSVPFHTPSSGPRMPEAVLRGLGSETDTEDDFEDDEAAEDAEDAETVEDVEDVEDDEDAEDVDQAPTSSKTDTSRIKPGSISEISTPRFSTPKVGNTIIKSVQKSSSVPSYVRIILDKDLNVLKLEANTPTHVQEAWRKEGKELRGRWAEQLEDFDNKEPNWRESTCYGCLRSSIWQPGKCRLTKKMPGTYACLTCWNKNAICIGWDEGKQEYFLRTQLIEARKTPTIQPGPFDVDVYLSGRQEVLRTKLPNYWQDA